MTTGAGAQEAGAAGVTGRRRYRFFQVDVFTDVVFGGNPLAVFPEGEGLSAEEMQAIAREMNLSETTFVLPAGLPGAAARVRIFTPGSELAFAGHPTLGTAWVLASLGRLGEAREREAEAGEAMDVVEAVLEEGIGGVPVRLEEGGSFVWMGHRDARFGEEVRERSGVARALGLSGGDLLAGAPIRVGSTGTGFLFVPLRDREAVDRAVLDVRALLGVHDDPESNGVFVFAPDGTAEDERGRTVRVYSRMFAPHTVGIPEDPATGSASGPLGAYVVENGLAGGVARGEVVRVLSEQGTKMGRRSLVHVRVRAGGAGEGGPTPIQVGGGVVPVLEGVLTL